MELNILLEQRKESKERENNFRQQQIDANQVEPLCLDIHPLEMMVVNQINLLTLYIKSFVYEDFDKTKNVVFFRDGNPKNIHYDNIIVE